MTASDQKRMEESIKRFIDQIRHENQQYRDTLAKEVEPMARTLERVSKPLDLEQKILSEAQRAIHESVKSVLTGYSSPLSLLVKSVIDENSQELRSLISDAFRTVIRTDDFKKSIIDAFSHKVARTIISNNEGLFEKVANDLKQDSVFKAKMALAVANVVEECLTDRKTCGSVGV